MKFECESCRYNQIKMYKGDEVRVCMATNPPTVINDVNTTLPNCPLDNREDRLQISEYYYKRGY